ncbi:MAG: metallophosphoesterase family protein [Paracoccaceae bacterium]
MRLAILTDIHANRQAFQAVLDDVAGRDIDRIALLGDIVGYGADPGWCVDRAAALVQAGALAILGNHDAAIAVPDPAMNPAARQTLDWTRERLSPAQAAFLAGLPLTARIEDMLFVHASAHAPRDWIYVTSTRSARPGFMVSDARLIFCGHVHVPRLFTCDRARQVREHRVPIGAALPLLRSRRWMAVVGSVGQPRDGVPQAGYAILDTRAETLAFRRVPYDVAAAAARLRAAGFPVTLALRLLKGA